MSNLNNNSPPNDFNYPSLSRKDLMSLSTITKNDFSMKNIKNRITSTRDWSLNLYNLDIEKAMPNRQSIYTHKIDYINKVDDIDKARAIRNTRSGLSYSLMNRDIEKAYPSKQYRYSRQTNPLEPVYDFPKVVDPGPYEIPKFIRNTLDISDIDKARPKKSQMFAPAIKSYNDNIEKSQPKKPYVRKVFYDSFSYSDVYQKKKRFIRDTNPIWPDYGHYGGDIDKSHPQFAYNPFRLPGTLSCDDIRGTQPGTKNKHNLINTRHLAYSCEDIIGACQGTAPRGLNSNRMTNPLQPSYQYLGREEINKEPPRLFHNHPMKPPLSKSQILSNSISNNFFSILNKKDDEKAKEENGSTGTVLNNEQKDILNHNDRYSKANENVKQITNEKYERASKVNWSEMPYYEEKPVFESELYKRPNPYYPFRHHRELILTKTKPHTLNRKYGVYNNYNKDSVIEMNSNPNQSDTNNKTSSHQSNQISGKRIDNKLMNPPTYEEQLTHFIKESAY